MTKKRKHTKAYFPKNTLLALIFPLVLAIIFTSMILLGESPPYVNEETTKYDEGVLISIHEESNRGGKHRYYYTILTLDNGNTYWISNNAAIRGGWDNQTLEEQCFGETVRLRSVENFIRFDAECVVAFSGPKGDYLTLSDTNRTRTKTFVTFGVIFALSIVALLPFGIMNDLPHVKHARRLKRNQKERQKRALERQQRVNNPKPENDG